jgi:Pectate lyase superfamily protein
MKKIYFAIMLAAVRVLSAQTQINPVSQVNWPAATGSGAPTQYCPTSVNGTLTNLSSTVTAITPTSVLLNQTVTGTGIPTSTTVTGINAAAFNVTLSQAATSGGVTALSFYSLGMPYTDTLNNVQYVCGSSGWIKSEGATAPGGSYKLPAYGSASSSALSPSNLTTDSTSNNLTVPGALSAKNMASIGPRYDVTQFGAVGNGIADDTAAIQSAFTACYNAGGGTIEFPGTHTYLVTGTLYAYDTCRLEGQRGTVATSPASLSPPQIYTNMGNVSGNTAPATTVVVSNNRTGAQIYTAMDPSNRPVSQIANWELAVTATNTFAANEWVELSGCTNPTLNNIIAQVGSANSSSFTAVYNGFLTVGTYSGETCTATQTTVVIAFDSAEHEVDSSSNIQFGSHITGSGTYNFPEGVDLYYSGRIDSGNNLYRTWFESPHYFGVYYADGGEAGKIEEGSRGDTSDYYQVYWRVGGTDTLTVVNSEFGPGAAATHGASSAGGGFLLDNSACDGSLRVNFDHMIMENDVNMTSGLADITLLQCPASATLPQFQMRINSSGIAAPSSVTGVTILQVSPASDLAASLDFANSQIAIGSNTTNVLVGMPYVNLYAQFGLSGIFSNFHYFPSLQSWGLNVGSRAVYNQPAQILGDLDVENLFQFTVPGSLWLNSDTAFAALPSGTTLAQGQVLAPPAYFDCGTGSGCGRYAVDVVQSPGTVGTLNSGSTTCTNAVASQPNTTCTSATGLMVGQYVTTATGATRVVSVNASIPSAVVVTLANNQTVYTIQPISYTAPTLGKEAQLLTKSSAAPTAGTWSQGDMVQNSAASSGGTCLWVNTAAGTPGTWDPIPCNAAYQLSYQPGPLTSVSATISAYAKIAAASTVDNLTGSAMSFTCSGNPVVTMYECGTSTTCATPTTIGSVTVTAAGTATVGTVSNPAITAGDYVAWALTGGTCSALNVAASAQVHSN